MKTVNVHLCVCVCFVYPAVALPQNTASLQSSRCHERKLHPLILLISTPSITDGGLISEITCDGCFECSPAESVFADMWVGDVWLENSNLWNKI